MDKLMTAKQVCQRFGGISDMTLWRWLEDAGMNFPQPFYIRRCRYWHESEIEGWIAGQQE